MYPDSVNLVKPPKTTRPKTPAALPSSQYATIFSLISGKNFSFLWVLLIVLLREKRGDGELKVSDSLRLPAVEACRLLDRRVVRNGDFFGGRKEHGEGLLRPI